MLDRLRIPVFLLGCWFLAIAVLCELAARPMLSRLSGGAINPQTPGIAIGYLAILDLMLLHSVGLMALQLVVPRSVLGRLQGPATLVLAVLGLIAVLVLTLTAFGLVMLLVTLLLAVPFGTIAYVAGWGYFSTGAAAATLLVVMCLKVGFAVLLIAAHQGFLRNRGLMILLGLSLGATWVVGFLHAYPPGFLVSIVDAAAALVIGVIGLVWLVRLVIGSVYATLRAVRSLV